MDKSADYTGTASHQASRWASTRASSGARFTISLCTVMDELQALKPPSFACAKHSSPAVQHHTVSA